MIDPQIIGSVTLLNKTGDVTIAWDSSSKEKVIAFIQKKMSEGVKFFIVKEIASIAGISISRKKNLKEKNLDSLSESGEVVLKTKEDKKVAEELAKVFLDDSDAEDLVSSGAAVVSAPVKSNEVSKVAKSAEEVYTNRTLAVPRVVGG